jgi:hypothetical protein
MLGCIIYGLGEPCQRYDAIYRVFLTHLIAIASSNRSIVCVRDDLDRESCSLINGSSSRKIGTFSSILATAWTTLVTLLFVMCINTTSTSDSGRAHNHIYTSYVYLFLILGRSVAASTVVLPIIVAPIISYIRPDMYIIINMISV